MPTSFRHSIILETRPNDANRMGIRQRADLTTLILSSAAIAASLIGHRGGFYDWVAKAWSSWILWASGVRVHVEGIEHIRGDRPQIIASNHQSWYDVFALAANVPKRFRFIAKEELRRIPLFGRAWESAGHISINRSDRKSAITALDAAASLVRGDNSSISQYFLKGLAHRMAIFCPSRRVLSCSRCTRVSTSCPQQLSVSAQS